MRQFRILLVSTCLLALLVPLAAAQQLPLVRVGIIVDGPWERNDGIREMFRQEILALTDGEFDVRFPADKMIEADWTLAGVDAAVTRLLNDRDVDMVITLGVQASQNISLRGPLPKPCVAPTVIDAIVQELPSSNGRSGVRNLNYLVIPNNMVRDMKAFRTIVPFTRVAVLLSESIVQAIPHEAGGFRDLLATIGLDASIHPVGETVDKVIAELTPEVEAVYVAPLLQVRSDEYRRLIDTLIERGLPSFSMLGPDEVERGLLASLSSELFPRLSRRVALNVQRILLGEDAGEIPTAFSAGERLTINMETARAIDTYPPWSVLTDAVLINDERKDVERRLTLWQVSDEALDANLDLAVNAFALAAAAQDVNVARAALLPQIDLSLFGVVIDKETAESSMGQAAERTLSGSVQFSQVIFSEPAWANRSIQRHLQNGREFQREILKLDILQSSATAYLNLLRAKATERIQKDNLARTRSNLELAHMREALGSAGAAEVLRWESELANNRKSVIEANSQRNLAEIAVNRLLHRPTEEDFVTEEVDLNDPQLLLPLAHIIEYMNNPWDFRVFRRFMVQEGLRRTPEVRALQESIAAQERALSAASRALVLPQVGMFAEVNNVFDRAGVGSAPASPGATFLQPEDLTWQLGISVTYPLFSGGEKFHLRSQAITTAAELRMELQSTSEKIEQRIRSALHQAGASYAGMGQAQVASQAASASLELVLDAYSRGAATILDVLDAQNNARVAAEVAADAIYDFLIDMVEVERSAGRMEMQMSTTERDEFHQRLAEFYRNNRP